MPWLLIVQFVLAVIWWTVPALATVPAWLIFLPFILPSAVLGGMFICFLGTSVLTIGDVAKL